MSALRELLCGADVLTSEVVLAHLEFENFPPDSPLREQLVRFIRELSDRQLRQFTRLAASSAALSPDPALRRSIKIRLVEDGDLKRLPKGSTCSVRIVASRFHNFASVHASQTVCKRLKKRSNHRSPCLTTTLSHVCFY